MGGSPFFNIHFESLRSIPIPPVLQPLVALADEVVLQRLNGLCGVSCLLGLAVVCDQDGLLRRGDGDAGSSLGEVAWSGRCSLCHSIRNIGNPYLAGVDVAVVDTGDDESLAGDVDALGMCLVHGGRVTLGDVGEVLHLLGAELFAISYQLAAPWRMRSVGIGCEGESSLGGGHNMGSFLKWRGNSVP